MSSVWQALFGKGAPSSSSTPTDAIFLHLSKTNVQRISDLLSVESQKVYLNPNQCRSLSRKLERITQNLEGLAKFFNMTSHSLPIEASKNFYRVSESAKELVENCCSEDWCQASAFQIQNEEAFKEILLEASLCYNSIFELAKAVSSNCVHAFLFEDLRLSSEFEPPSQDEVLNDQIVLLERYKDSIDDSNISVRQRHLSKHLLRRLKHVHLRHNLEDFNLSTSSLWPDGKSPDDEWGKNSDFLGGNVCKTTWLDVPCAKKVFYDGVQEKEILAEAKILASLNHPNTVKFICCGHEREKTWHFIAMEHMETSLCSVIKRRTTAKKGAPFSLFSAVDIMLQIANGTCYLHDNGVAHRDLKTSNVVVRHLTTQHLQDYLQVKLVDFGLSKVKLSASRSNTISRPKIGTTVYMPPEAFNNGRANWFKADAYSFGMLCYVILSGEEPFQHVPRTKVCIAVCEGERPMLPSETPEELASLIKKCWHPDRCLRPDFVEICSKLAEIRHKLLEERLRPRILKQDLNVHATSYIQQMLRSRTDDRKQNISHINPQAFLNVIEEVEFVEEEVDAKEEPQGASQISSHIAMVKSVDMDLLVSRRPYRCQHEGCEKTFKNLQTMKMHHKTHFGDATHERIILPSSVQSLKADNKKIPSRCPKCRKTFVGLYELRRHYGRKHSEGEKPFNCRKCGKKFYLEGDTRDHERWCGEPLECKCGLRFAFRCNLVAHKKAHPACQNRHENISQTLASAVGNFGGEYLDHRSRQMSDVSSSPTTSSTNYQSSASPRSDSEQISRGSSYPSGNPGSKRQYEEIISPMTSLQLPPLYSAPDVKFVGDALEMPDRSKFPRYDFSKDLTSSDSLQYLPNLMPQHFEDELADQGFSHSHPGQPLAHMRNASAANDNQASHAILYPTVPRSKSLNNIPMTSLEDSPLCAFSEVADPERAFSEFEWGRISDFLAQSPWEK